MKRKRPSVEIRKSDQPKKRMRDTAMRILLPTDLVRRISEFVLELTHVQYVESLLYHTSKNSLTYPLFEIDTVDIRINNPYQHIPNEYYQRKFPKNSFISMSNWQPKYLLRFQGFSQLFGQRYAIFKTIEFMGAYIIQIPIKLIKKIQARSALFLETAALVAD